MTPAQLDTLNRFLADEEVLVALRTPLEAVCCALEAQGFAVNPRRTVTRLEGPDGLHHRTEASFVSAAEGLGLVVQQHFDVQLDGATRLYLEVRGVEDDVRLRHSVLRSTPHARWTAKKHAIAILKGELDGCRFFAPESWAEEHAAELTAQLQP